LQDDEQWRAIEEEEEEEEEEDTYFTVNNLYNLWHKQIFSTKRSKLTHFHTDF
jgi:hypothetical protein